MASSDKFPTADLNALAAEALDLWQEYLATSAADPKAKAEMMQLLEPSRRVFADWAAMMQHGAHAHGGKSAPAPASGAPAARSSPDDGALRLAQLAHRLAELEKRVDKVEARGAGKASKASRASSKPKSGA